nr:DUF3857 domain-containing protein [candidate division Zixibacteria bacterium]
MRILHLLSVITILLLVTLLTAESSRAQMSISGQQDIGQLMKIAREQYNLADEDAVILFDGQRQAWSEDGRLTTYVHRIIWIATDVAINKYGDHRIPYDDANCTYHVVTVRTWHDSTWWITGETGIVETLPEEVETAYDYTNLREMMLLHNGIEVPCIIEVAYYIEDKRPFRSGADGVWLFEREDPCVMSWFGLSLKEGAIPQVKAPVDAVYENKTDPNTGLTDHWWKMGPLPARKRPAAVDPAAYTPHLSWSTWTSWTALGNYFKGAFEPAAVLDSTLQAQVDSAIENARTENEKASLLAEFVNQRTRYIDYPESFWQFSPRPAVVTYNTGYGHRLDRAILAAALMQRAGLKIRPIFLSTGFGNIDENVPTLARFAGLGLWISGDDLEVYFDPSDGALYRGLGRLYSRTAWSPGFDEIPTIRLNGDTEANQIFIRIDLDMDAGLDTVTGSGFLSGDNGLNPYGQMSGLHDETGAFLGELISSILDKANLINHNQERFDLFNVTTGFEFALPKIEPDDNQRIPLVINDPSFGIANMLPDDIALYDQNRQSPVRFQCLLHQKVEIHLNLNGYKPVYLPESRTVTNEAGQLTISVTQKDDRIVYIRELSFTSAVFDSDLWPALRELLLANNHKRNRVIYLAADED